MGLFEGSTDFSNSKSVFKFSKTRDLFFKNSIGNKKDFSLFDIKFNKENEKIY